MALYAFAAVILTATTAFASAPWNAALPPLPFATFAANISITDSSANPQKFFWGTVRVDLSDEIFCAPSETARPNATLFKHLAERRDYAARRQLFRITSLHTGDETCGNVTRDEPMPTGGHDGFAPSVNATLLNVTNATSADGEAITVYKLKDATALTMQLWTVRRAAPFVPVSMTTISEAGHVSTVQFISYEQISTLGAQCDPAAFECTDLRCVAQPAASQAALYSAISWVCGIVDCSPINKGGAFYFPVTPVAHATWAFNAYYKKFSAQGGNACNFNGAGVLMACDNSAGVHCGVSESATPAQLEESLKWLCGSAQGLQDCSPIRKGGAHFLPNTTIAHADWAFNAFFQAYRCVPGWNACDFGGAARLFGL